MYQSEVVFQPIPGDWSGITIVILKRSSPTRLELWTFSFFQPCEVGTSDVSRLSGLPLLPQRGGKVPPRNPKESPWYPQRASSGHCSYVVNYIHTIRTIPALWPVRESGISLVFSRVFCQSFAFLIALRVNSHARELESIPTLTRPPLCLLHAYLHYTMV